MYIKFKWFRGAFNLSVGEVFSDSKWEIIKDLSNEKLSPLQLAEKYSTTLGNVGHQLRILEAYGLVKKEKISNRDKGKPRMLFSLADDYAYLVSAAKGFANKKLLNLSGYHDTILRMWFVNDSKMHYFLEKFYWSIEEHIDYINGMAVKIVGDKIDVILLTDLKTELSKRIKGDIVIKDRGGLSVSFNSNLCRETDLKKFDLSEYHVIYDPKNIFHTIKKSLKIIVAN